MKICVLVALGPNSVEVPCRIFPQEDTLEVAKKKCDDLLGIIGEENKDCYIYNVPFTNVATGEFEVVRTIIPEKDLSKYVNVKILANKVINGKVRYKYTLPTGKEITISKVYLPKDTKEKLIFIEHTIEVLQSNDIIIADKVFTSYYGGCGEVFTYVLTEVETESKFVNFNLD